jgi:alpha-tubulin suppressor-like RCC1 family protein
MVLGWGEDSNGQLGNDASPASEPAPVAMSLPAGSQITGISAGYDHSLAVTSAGGVLASGRNEVGQLGNGTTTDSATPVPVSVPQGTSVTQASAGAGFSLAVTSDGQALAWGDNEEGQLGDGGTGSSPVDVPVAVALPSGTTVTQVAAGVEDWGLALTSDGRVLAWGDNLAGQLGDGTTANAYTPVPVSLPSGVTVTQIAAGADTGYALTSAGTVYAWGAGAGGTLGNGSTAGSDVPVAVSLPTGTTVTQISSEGSFALALTSAGQVLAWGGNSAGQLGNGGTASSAVPAAVSLPSGITVRQVAAGGSFGLAATTTGSVLAWGDNVWGELGNGTTTRSAVPTPVSLPTGTHVGTLTAGQDHALALPVPAPQVTAITPQDGLAAGGGTVTITGSGFTGATAVYFGTAKATSVKITSDTQLTAGIPAGTGRVDVTVASPLGGTSATSPAGQYSYLAKGSVLGWGYNAYGSLGNGQSGESTVPVPVAAHLPAGTVVTATATGGIDTYALTSSGAVYAWGYGGDGELGNGTTASISALPVKVSIPPGTVITAIAAAGYSGYALTSTGHVLAWGYGGDGELGNGSTAGSDVPVAVSLPSGTTVTALASMEYGGLARTSDGQALAWGYGAGGALGDGGTANSDVPVAVKLPTGTTVTSLSGSYFTGYARTSAGGVLAWGNNFYGELGDSTLAESDVPVPVSLPAGVTVTAVAAAGYSGYALTSTGHVLAWGYGGDGELGNGSTANSTAPVTVSLPSGTTATALAAEVSSGVARTASGGLLAWGANYDGDLGNGSTVSTDVPAAVRLPAGLSVTQLGPSLDDGDSVVVSPVTVVSGLSPRSGAAGTKVTITGLNLSGATGVKFGGTAAKFTVVSPTKITATAPAGSGTVAVTVTTPLGTSRKVTAGQFTY